jgi:hypothetical protein
MGVIPDERRLDPEIHIEVSDGQDQSPLRKND